MNRYVDLHTHSTYSDGSLAPAHLIREARKAGLSAIALTDHDVLDGVAEARAAGQVEGVAVVSGVEISTRAEPGEVHVLGLDVDPSEVSPLQQALRTQRAAREERAIRILEKLEALGMPLTIDEVKAIAGLGSLGRPHIAEAMMARGYISSVEEGFARFLREGGSAYAAREALTVPEAIALIRESGGLAAIAHPGLIYGGDFGRLERFLAGLIEDGLGGLECFTTAHDEGTTQACVGIARRLDLVPTGGSDYHGEKKPGARLGWTRRGHRIPEAILGDVRRWIESRRPGASPDAAMGANPRAL
jgi:predicted metal-dependent phosphoesterase TrpH